MKTVNVIFWDTETNGLEKHHSVLSISAIKHSFSFDDEKIESNIIEQYERFYFRKAGEQLGEEAVTVNGLRDEIISQRRSVACYPEHFCDDINSFRVFCKDTRHFVGHNIFYDKMYINFWLPNMFCTMRENTKIIGLKKANGQIKFPSLGETARFYDIETDANELHGSMYDSFITYQVFMKMLQSEKIRGKVISFLMKG